MIHVVLRTCNRTSLQSDRIVDKSECILRCLNSIITNLKDIFKDATTVPNIILKGGSAKRSRKLNNFIIPKNIKKSNVHKKRKNTKKVLSQTNKPVNRQLNRQLNRPKKSHTVMMM